MAAIAEALRDILFRFPCSVLEGVRWGVLCKAFLERFPEKSAALKSLSAETLANSWTDFAVYEECGNEDDGVFRLHDISSLKHCRNGQLACWPLLLQRLVEIVRTHGNPQQTEVLDAPHEDSHEVETLLSSDAEVVGVLLAQLKTLLRQHWDRGFEERAMGFFNETGSYVVIKKMKHLIAELLRWRRRRRSLSSNRGQYYDIDAALETPIMLATLQTHNDMILCCPITERACGQESSTLCAMDGSAATCREACQEPAAQEPQCPAPGSGVSDFQRALDFPDKMLNRLRIENAELKKKLRFDTDLLNKEIRSLRIENVELKKRLYFSSQYAPHAEQSPLPMKAVWMSPGMLTPFAGFTPSGQLSPAPSQGSATPIPQGFCYAMQLPQGMVSPNVQPWCTTLIAVPFTADAACAASGGDSTVSTTMSPCSTTESPSRTSICSIDSNKNSDIASPERWHSESIDSTQLHALSGQRDDRWVCIPSGIVERCTSQFEGCEGLEDDDTAGDSWMQPACTSVCEGTSQVTAETRTMIPSGIVERFKSHFEGHDAVPDSESSDLQLDRTVRFAIGDCVTVKPSVQNPKYNWGDVKHGEHGIIQSIDEDGNLHVDFPSQKGWVADPADMLCKNP
jgi:hypothetical protein